MTKELKPFDLEAAKNGDPICFEDGREIHFIGVTRDWAIAYEDERYPNEVCTSFSHNMRMKPKKIVRWVNLSDYEDCKPGKTAWHYDTEEQAKNDASEYYNTRWIAIAVRVEIEE